MSFDDNNDNGIEGDKKNTIECTMDRHLTREMWMSVLL